MTDSSNQGALENRQGNPQGPNSTTEPKVTKGGDLNPKEPEGGFLGNQEKDVKLKNQNPTLPEGPLASRAGGNLSGPNSQGPASTKPNSLAGLPNVSLGQIPPQQGVNFQEGQDVAPNAPNPAGNAQSIRR